MIANPGAALASAAGAAADEKMSQLVSGLAAAIGPFPAATLTGIALWAFPTPTSSIRPAVRRPFRPFPSLRWDRSCWGRTSRS